MDGAASMIVERAVIPSVDILGVPVSRVDMLKAVQVVLEAARDGRAQYVCVRDVHGLMHSVDDQAMMDIQHKAAMVTPDGMPLVIVARLRGYKDIGRVSGADLMDAVCAASQTTGARHFFYGGKEGVAEKLITNLVKRYPRLQVAGHYCPPFRALTREEDDAAVEMIHASGAQIVWVGISTPKQEFWMRDHVARLPGATLLGVGAAFDFHAGVVKRAPLWMQRNSLEWLHRLASEPRRLWRRYLVMAPHFVWRVVRESSHAPR
jgi:N-acetylglucosaminyldiphosphoundecaprenol N-acetyl-beta-D-mannosaminyltransferase